METFITGRKWQSGLLTERRFRTGLRRVLATVAFGVIMWPAASLAEDLGMMQHMITPQLMARVPDIARGRVLFAEKGCVLCHSVNGIGGTDGAAFDASVIDEMPDPLDFVANMWRGAPEMIKLQEEELGSLVEFSGEELGDIIGFLYSVQEQKKFTMSNLPDKVREALMKMNKSSPAEAAPGSMNGMKKNGKAPGGG